MLCGTPANVARSQLHQCTPSSTSLLATRRHPSRPVGGLASRRRRLSSVVVASGDVREEEAEAGSSSAPVDGEATTRKYGLEAGLWQVLTAKDAKGRTKGDQAKDLLKRYGSAYLITSISFALVSFAACYALVSAGVDVGALLARVGLQASDTSEKVGTFALAYAAHKALSPVRFPPTVALTPVVARWLGKDVAPADGSSDNGNGPTGE